MLRLILLWLIPLISMAEIIDAPHVLLERMAQASREQNYQGVMILAVGEQWQTLAIQHAKLEGQEYERLTQLDGQSQEYLRQGDVRLCSHNDDLSIHRILRNPLRVYAPTPEQNLPYDFIRLSKQRIAGRDAVKVRLQPHDNQRYALSFWLDEATALVLGVDMLDNQHLLERALYAQITLNQSFQTTDFSPRMAAHQLEPITHPEQPIGAVEWLPHWLPADFHLIYAHQEEDTTRLKYFDGVSAFSVFIDSNQSAPALKRQWGATGAVVLAVNHNHQPLTVTAVGEVPLATLEQVALSVGPEVNEPPQE